MNNDQKFKDWLEKEYSCSLCNKELFKSEGKDEIKISFHYNINECIPFEGQFLGKKSCHGCYKKTQNENGFSFLYPSGRELIFKKQEFYKNYQEVQRQKNSILFPIAILEKVIEYAKKNHLIKCIQCQTYSFFITENETVLCEKFHFVNKTKYCHSCFKNLSSPTGKVGYLETRYFLYDLWEKSQGKFRETGTRIYIENRNEKPSPLLEETPNKSKLSEENKKPDVNYWPAFFFIICFVGSLVFLTVFVFAKVNRKSN